MSEKHHANMGIQHSGHEHPIAHARILRRAKGATLLIVLLLLIGAVLTIVTRVLHSQNLSAAVEQNARVYVNTVQAKGGGKTEAITLPSSLQGMIEAPIYARSSGYVLRWKKDIGAQVAKDEVLAEIDTPEVDAQLAQAKATRAQQLAVMQLAKTSAERWEELRKNDAVTQQDLNERRSAYAQAQANLAAADADLLRLQKLEGFKKVVAPFDGVIIRRDVNVGDLVNAGNAGAAAGGALFTLAKVNPLRMYVYVPQSFAARVKVDDPVSVTLLDRPGQPVAARIKHIAGAIDATTRTLQVEINLPNADSKLLAGAYAQVTLSAGSDPHLLLVPSNVLLFRPQGTQVAVVDASGRIKLHTVTVGHDLGSSLEILSGITADDRLVLNPADSLADNDLVTLQKPEAAGKAHS